MSNRKRNPKFKAAAPNLNIQTPEGYFRSSMVAARDVMGMCASALRAISPIFEEWGMPTFAIDKHYRVYASPSAIMNWVEAARAVSPENPCVTCGDTSHIDVAYVGGAICHEVWHPLRLHSSRADDIGVDENSHMRWNQGADCEINDDLTEIFKSVSRPKLCLPPGICLPSSFGLEDGKLAEFYYNSLEQQDPPPSGQGQGQGQGQQGQGQQGQGQQPTCGSGCDGRPAPWDKGEPADGDSGITEAEARIIRKKTAKKIAEASKTRGTVPAGFLRWAEGELEPAKYDWRKECRKAIPWAINRAHGEEQRTYRRLGRRCSAIGYKAIFPSTYTPKPVVKVGFDTSGSMNTEAINVGVAEVEGVVRAVGAEVHIIAGDAAAGKTQKVTGSIKGKLEMYGGGGTDMRELINKALKDPPLPNVVIIVTDGETPWPAAPLPKGCRLVVCLVGDHAVSVNSPPAWATVVKIIGEDVETSVAT